jgi:hypothetical protein
VISTIQILLGQIPADMIYAAENSMEHDLYDAISDGFYTQHVHFPTFQNENGKLTNVLDLIFTDEPNRVSGLRPGPKMGSKGKGHLVLRWNLVLSGDFELENDTDAKKVFIYKKGDYKAMNLLLSQVNWAKEFYKKDAAKQYARFLDIYQLACLQFIPISDGAPKKAARSDNSIIKELKRRRKKLWHQNNSFSWRNKKNNREYKQICETLEKEIENANSQFEQDLVIKSKENPKLLYDYISRRQTIKSA